MVKIAAPTALPFSDFPVANLAALSAELMTFQDCVRLESTSSNS
jgi:hypothetical protein